jgi:hypothetical protein
MKTTQDFIDYYREEELFLYTSTTDSNVDQLGIGLKVQWWGYIEGFQ